MLLSQIKGCEYCALYHHHGTVLYVYQFTVFTVPRTTVLMYSPESGYCLLQYRTSGRYHRLPCIWNMLNKSCLCTFFVHHVRLLCMYDVSQQGSLQICLRRTHVRLRRLCASVERALRMSGSGSWFNQVCNRKLFAL